MRVKFALSSLSARRAWIEITVVGVLATLVTSLSARRAWIEIQVFQRIAKPFRVALRKESVDRNRAFTTIITICIASLSARRAWIEILPALKLIAYQSGRSPQGERG